MFIYYSIILALKRAGSVYTVQTLCLVLGGVAGAFSMTSCSLLVRDSTTDSGTRSKKLTPLLTTDFSCNLVISGPISLRFSAILPEVYTPFERGKKFSTVMMGEDSIYISTSGKFHARTRSESGYRTG